MTREELRRRWVARREDLARLNANVDGARVIEEFLADLDAVDQCEADECVNLSRAAQLSGFSAEYLARRVREAKIPNAGRKYKPMIRRADLPRKSTKSLAARVTDPYDAAADARALLSRRGER